MSAVLTPKVYPSSVRSEMIGFVPATVRRLLDVGCNTGSFGAALKAARPVEVWGIEPSQAAARQAAQVLDRVIEAPFSEQAEIPTAHFDAVVFNDVLEHLVDPWEALRLAESKLRAGGCVIASIPNLRQIDNLLHILIERDFRYEPLGIRDRTHLRFFTRTSALRLFDESGFRVTRIEGINEVWWAPRIGRRLAFRMLGSWLEDTKYMQFAVVAVPESTRSRDTHDAND